MSLRIRIVVLVAALAAAMAAVAFIVPMAGERSATLADLAGRREIADHAVRGKWSEETGRLALVAPSLVGALADPDLGAAAQRLATAVSDANASRGWLLRPDASQPIEQGEGLSYRETPAVEALTRRARAAGRASGLVVDGARAAWIELVAIPTSGAVGALELTLDSRFASRLAAGFGVDLVLAGVRTADGRTVALGAFADNAARGDLLGALDSVGAAKSMDTGEGLSRIRVMSLESYEGGRLVAALRPAADSRAGGIADIRGYLAGALAGIALLGLVFAALAGGRLASLFVRLERAARDAIEGQGSYEPVVCNRRDEIGSFVRTFNTMNESVRQREQRIRHAAYRDPVTKLPTRVLFDERASAILNRVRAQGLTASLLLVQIDQLREVNESLGRQAADHVLAELADRFRGVLRGTRMLDRDPGAPNQEASVLARTGAYEFAVMLRQCDPATARKVGLRLADIAAKRFRFEGQSLTVSVRIGVAGFPEHGNGIADLMQSADFAVVGAAQQLGGVAVFDPVFETEREKQLAMLGELREALEQRQLHMVFQPKVSLNGDSALMAEALMRWVHPERGAQNPAEFVGFAEKTGFISKMTQWAIEGSLRHAAEWKREGLPMTIAVNLSRRDLTNPEFPTQVVGALRRYGLQGEALMFEINESVLVGAPAVVTRNIELLARVGVMIAVDNYGTGFGSIELLSKLPLHALKVDRRYVSRLCEDPAAQIVVRASIELARALGLKSVAEGVETAEQLAALREMGCDQAQGYYLGRPLTRDDFEVWVRHQAAKYGVHGAAPELRPAGAGTGLPGAPGGDFPMTTDSGDAAPPDESPVPGDEPVVQSVETDPISPQS